MIFHVHLTCLVVKSANQFYSLMLFVGRNDALLSDGESRLHDGLIISNHGLVFKQYSVNLLRQDFFYIVKLLSEFILLCRIDLVQCIGRPLRAKTDTVEEIPHASFAELYLTSLFNKLIGWRSCPIRKTQTLASLGVLVVIIFFNSFLRRAVS